MKKVFKIILIVIAVLFVGVIAIGIFSAPEPEKFSVPEFTGEQNTEERVLDIYSRAGQDAKEPTLERAKYCKEYLLENYDKDLEANMYYASYLYNYGVATEDNESIKAGSLARSLSEKIYLNTGTVSDQDYTNLADALHALDY